ncbi:MAG: hypothetical protein AB4352_09320 [Hormoscilla sp.]
MDTLALYTYHTGQKKMRSPINSVPQPHAIALSGVRSPDFPSQL